MKKSVSAANGSQAEQPINVAVAATPFEKRRIYQFRYQVYVEEMGKIVANADHEHHIIQDAMDDFSVQIYATDNKDIVGTLRVTMAEADRFPKELSEIFQMHQFESLCGESNSKQLSLSTKLAVKSNYRSSPVMYLLLAKAYNIARERKIQFNFGGSNPCMLQLYEQIGYRRYTRNFTDPGYGLLIPLVMIVEDINHFRAVKSPFYRLGRKWPNNPHAAREFERAFPEAASHLNSQLASKEQAWNEVRRLMRQSPNIAIPLLSDLSEEECSSLLHFGAIFSCHDGDCIIGQGDLSNEVFILLAGTLLSESMTDSAELILAGQSFGGSALINPLPSPVKITALSDSHIIVVSRQAFLRFSNLYPDAALKITNKLSLATTLPRQRKHAEA